jgi:hypothetical protein
MKDSATILDSSGEPSSPTGRERLTRVRHLVWVWLKSFLKPEHVLAILALFVIAGQLGLMLRQTNVMNRQTKIMDQQFRLAATQQELVTRPTVELMLGRGSEDKTPWRLVNHGPFRIRNVSMRTLHFKKFSNLGWQDSVSSVGLLSEMLNAEGSVEIPFAKWLKRTPYDVAGYTPVEGADFITLEIQSRREIDDKVYLYLQPVQLIGAMTWIIRPAMAASSGPLQKPCTPESFSTELMYEFYRRNPMQYPVELYNFHYLLGNDPATNCLKSFRTMHP